MEVEPLMNERRYEYAARVANVVDADTLDLPIDLGFGVFTKQRVRLYGPDPDGKLGMDAPEKTRRRARRQSRFSKTRWRSSGQA